MARKVQFACAGCGRSRVLLDAWAAWDEAAQRWVLSETFPTAHCKDCEGETRLVERELTGQEIT